MAKKRCFVIQGFGRKTDFRTGRAINLDDSYAIIKEAVEEAGLECIRADEKMHSGSIDVEMWDEILTADLCIADVSTSNWNAAYELGVRHALRPRTTIVVAESQFEFAFDINHVAIHSYVHGGPELGRGEAQRFKEHLKTLIAEIVTDNGDAKPDSPVFISLPGISPPEVNGDAWRTGGTAPAVSAVEPAYAKPESEAPTTEVEPPSGQQDWKELQDRAMAAKAQDPPDWDTAKDLFGQVHELLPREEFITHQLALATYKSKTPSKEQALKDAQAVLEPLEPDTTNDPETLGLWGAVHKNLWDLTQNREHLSTAIRSYGRGFWLKNDHYNGINFAFLLNVRATMSEPAEAIADWMQAEEIRREVIKIASAELDHPVTEDDEYWLRATLWEAHVGLGDKDGARKWEQEARQRATAEWMTDSTEGQLAKYEALLADPPTHYLRDGDEAPTDELQATRPAAETPQVVANDRQESPVASNGGRPDEERTPVDDLYIVRRVWDERRQADGSVTRPTFSQEERGYLAVDQALRAAQRLADGLAAVSATDALRYGYERASGELPDWIEVVHLEATTIEKISVLPTREAEDAGSEA